MPKSKELTKDELIIQYKKWELIIDSEQPYKYILDERQKLIRLKAINIGLITFAIFIAINSFIFDYFAWCDLYTLILFAVTLGILPANLYLIIKDATIVQNKVNKNIDLLKSVKFIIPILITGLLAKSNKLIENKDFVTLVLFSIITIEYIIIFIFDCVYKHKRKKNIDNED